MYSIIFTKKAEKQLSRLETNIKNRIIIAIDRAKIRPESYFIRLVGEDLYKLRVGDYRVIAEIHGDKFIILVVKIGHRKEVYKKYRNV